MEMKKIYDKVKEEAKQYLVDTTAFVVVGNPISAGFETLIAGMSDDVSMNARFIATGLAYAGLGSAVSKGRDLWRKSFGINERTREKIQQISDIAYLTAFNSVFAPAFYYVSGSRDFKEIAIGTAAAAGLSLAFGGPIGYVIDAARDLTNVRKSERIPAKIRNLGSRTKKSLAALALAGSLGITAGIYGATPNKTENYQPQRRIEQIQERNSLEDVADYQLSNELNQGEKTK
jgi:hypothetical protein